MRTFQRAFLRADLYIRHTEGFNPHAYISIGLPLQLGCESICEVLDIEVPDGIQIAGLPDCVNPFLPEGITLNEAYIPVKKASAVKYAKYRIEMAYEREVNDLMEQHIRTFFTQDHLTILKKTKKGEGEADLAPGIRCVETTAADARTLILEAVLSAQNPTVNPSHLLSALRTLAPAYAPTFSVAYRMELYDEDMLRFR
jgi:radical SAM-linked protein